MQNNDFCELRLDVDGDGFISIMAAGSEVSNKAPFGYIISNGLFPPISAQQYDNIIKLSYEIGEVVVAVEKKDRYHKLCILSAPQEAEGWVWGPYPLTLNKGYGEIIGSANDDSIAVCLQSLNPKTEGGFPPEYVNVHPLLNQIISREGEREQINSCAALPLREGTALQAFARNRTKLTYRDYLFIENALVLPVEGEDANLKDSAIALFACDKDALLDSIGYIEETEGLPHPVIGGEWAKQSSLANESYLISDFSEDSLDEALSYTQMAGLKCLYHPGPFQSWGHFPLEPDSFPNGDAGLARCADIAKAHGIHLGFHCLTNFMTLNDRFVTPNPHPDILVMGETVLIKDMLEEDTVIHIKDGAYFKHKMALSMFRVDDELIQFESMIQSEEGVTLMGCTRNAQSGNSSRDGNIGQKHVAGTKVFRLWDYGYNTLFPNLRLQKEFARRLSELVKTTGIERLSFDGLEGCSYTGHGDYANSRFVEDCYDQWGPGVRTDASGLSHYRWHLHNYMNWGEPWYADMRNGMFEYRNVNQAYYKRNLFPCMMGWYSLQLSKRKYEATTPDDIEWMMSKATGFSAGFALSANMNALRQHGLSAELLKIVNSWESMRRSGILSDEIRAQMRTQHSEWHLSDDENGWKIHRVTITQFECSPDNAQPGQPKGSFLMGYNPYHRQIFSFRLRAGDGRDDGSIINPSFHMDSYSLSFDVAVGSGQYLVYEGGTEAVLYDSNFNVIKHVAGIGSELNIGHGVFFTELRCIYDGERAPYPVCKIFLEDAGEIVPKKE